MVPYQLTPWSGPLMAHSARREKYLEEPDYLKTLSPS
jgi:hypothetical protein